MPLTRMSGSTQIGLPQRQVPVPSEVAIMSPKWKGTYVGKKALKVFQSFSKTSWEKMALAKGTLNISIHLYLVSPILPFALFPSVKGDLGILARENPLINELNLPWEHSNLSSAHLLKHD